MQITNFRLLGGKLSPPGPPTAALALSPPEKDQASSSLLAPLPNSADVSGSADPNDLFSPPDNQIVTEEPMSGSGLTPPSSPPPTFKRQPIAPARQSSLLQAIAPASKGPFSTCVAETLVIGPNGVMSLAPLSPVLKLEELCKRGKTNEAIALVDDERRRGRRGEVDSDKVSYVVTILVDRYLRARESKLIIHRRHIKLLSNYYIYISLVIFSNQRCLNEREIISFEVKLMRG